MFRHVLIPLDGSAAAEAAVSVGVFLAERAGGCVTLLHVVEQAPPESIHGERHLRAEGEAEAYLRGAAERLVPPSVRSGCHVHAPTVRDVAGSIAEHLQELAPDLIVMAVHGERGLRRFLFGNMAQQVASRSTVPVILVRDPPRAGAFPGWRSILIPHSSDSAHEDALPAGFEIARLCRARTHVVMAVPTRRTRAGDTGTATLLPSATRAVLALASLDAEQHLAGHRAEQRAAGLEVTTEICRGAPVPCLRKAAAAVKADLVVLGTHGRTGAGAFWEGSVAARVCSGSRVSVMLVPAARSPEEAPGP